MAERIELKTLEIEGDLPSTTSPIPPVVLPSPRTRVNVLGLLLAVLSSLFFSLSTLIVKWLRDVDPLELVFVRFVGILLPAVPIVIYKNLNPFPKGQRRMLLLRSVAGAVTVSLVFYAVRQMPLGDASVIIFSTPVAVAVFARIFLKEPCGSFHCFTLFLTVLGVILIARPPFLFGRPTKAYDFTGPLAALSSTIFGAVVYVSLRTLKNLHFSVVLVAYATCSILQTSGTAWAAGRLRWPKCGTERLLVVALGAFSFTAQMLLTVAAQLEEAGLVAIARTVDVVFAFVWQILFFDEIPNALSVIGAILVTLSVALIGLRKWMMSMSSSTRPALGKK